MTDYQPTDADREAAKAICKQVFIAANDATYEQSMTTSTITDADREAANECIAANRP
jgi:hypothetical protein